MGKDTFGSPHLSAFVRKSAFGIEGSKSRVQTAKDSVYRNSYSNVKQLSLPFRAIPRHHPGLQSAALKESVKERAVNPLVDEYGCTSSYTLLKSQQEVLNRCQETAEARPVAFYKADNDFLLRTS